MSESNVAEKRTVTDVLREARNQFEAAGHNTPERAAWSKVYSVLSVGNNAVPHAQDRFLAEIRDVLGAPLEEEVRALLQELETSTEG